MATPEEVRTLVSKLARSGSPGGAGRLLLRASKMDLSPKDAAKVKTALETAAQRNNFKVADAQNIARQTRANENKPKSEQPKPKSEAEKKQDSRDNATRRVKRMKDESFRLRNKNQSENFNNRNKPPAERQEQKQQGGASGAERQRLANANAKRAAERKAAPAAKPAAETPKSDTGGEEKVPQNRQQRRAAAKEQGNLGTKGDNRRQREGRKTTRKTRPSTGSKRVVGEGPKAGAQRTRPGARNKAFAKKTGNPDVDARIEKLNELYRQDKITKKEWTRGVSNASARSEVSDEIIRTGEKNPAGTGTVQREAAKAGKRGEVTDRAKQNVERAANTGGAPKKGRAGAAAREGLTAKQAHDRIQAALKANDPNHVVKPYKGKNPDAPASGPQMKKLEGLGGKAGTVKGEKVASDARKNAEGQAKGKGTTTSKAVENKKLFGTKIPNVTAKQAHERIQDDLEKADPNHKRQPFRGKNPDAPASPAQLKKLGETGSQSATSSGSAPKTSGSAPNAEGLTAKQAHERIQAAKKKADPNYKETPFRGKNPDSPATDSQKRAVSRLEGGATGSKSSSGGGSGSGGTGSKRRNLFNRDAAEASAKIKTAKPVPPFDPNEATPTRRNLFNRDVEELKATKPGGKGGTDKGGTGAMSKDGRFIKMGGPADRFTQFAVGKGLPAGAAPVMRFALPAVAGYAADQVAGNIINRLDPTPNSDSYLGGALKATARGAIGGGAAGAVGGGVPGALIAAPIGGAISLGSYVLGGGAQNQETLEEAIANIRNEAAVSGTDPKLTNAIIGRLRLTGGRARRMRDTETEQNAIAAAYDEIGGVLGTPAVQNPFNVDVINQLSRSSTDRLMPIVNQMDDNYKLAAIQSLQNAPAGMYAQVAANQMASGGDLGGGLSPETLANVASGFA